MQPKIMLVDDREDNLLSMETVLEPDGYRFVKASSGRQVLKHLLTDLDFALILMDVQMPNLNGFETAALIYERERLRHIPIIFITANNYGDENLFKGYRAGAVDYIYKPVNPELLRVKVGVFVDLYRKNQRLLAQEQKLVAINRNLELEIGERKASEEKVTELNKQLLENISRLEAANKDLDLFAFMASHDLQAPLRKIRMFSDRLLANGENTLGKEGKLYLTRIQEVSRRMQDLINDILRFSKIAVEKQSFEDVDLNEVVGEVLSEMEGVVREKNARVVVEDRLPAPELPHPHPADQALQPILVQPTEQRDRGKGVGHGLDVDHDRIVPRVHRLKCPDLRWFAGRNHEAMDPTVGGRTTRSSGFGSTPCTDRCDDPRMPIEFGLVPCA